MCKFFFPLRDLHPASVREGNCSMNRWSVISRGKVDNTGNHSFKTPSDNSDVCPERVLQILVQIPAHTNCPTISKIACGCGSHPVLEQNSARGLY